MDAGDDNSACAFALDIVGYNKRVLEVGCGDGAFTKALSDRGCQVVGVEIDAEAAAIAEKWAQAVVVGDLGSGEVWHELEDEQFDAITFLGILEKLRDPLETVRVAVRLLKPSGIVTISVPNIAHGDVRISLLNGHFSYGGGGLLDRDQLRFFTESELRNLIRDAGLVPVEIRRVLMPLFQSELGIKRKSVPEATVKQILEDPDAETYQFVVKAILDNGTTTLTQLADRVLELQARTDYEIVRTALRHKEMHDIEELQRRNQALQQQNVALESQLRGAAGEIERKNDSMQRTETWALEMEALALAREEVISALSGELAALRVELEEIRSSAEQSRAQIDTLLKTRAFRLMSPFRRLYGRVRRGRRSMPTQSA